MGAKATLLTQYFTMAGNIGITKPGYRLASAASYCCTLRDIMDLDPDDRSLLDSAFDPTISKDTKDRIVEVNGYDDITSNEVEFVANSASQAIDTVLKAVVKDGDQVITTVPNWPQFAGWDNDAKTYEGLPYSGIKADVETLPLTMENNWAFPMELLQEKVSSKTKLIAVQSPGHNPTGNNFDIKALCEIAEDVGAYLLHDEIYRGLERDAPFSTPPAINLYENAVATNSLSKSLGLEGLRLGWIASRNKELMSKCSEVSYWGRGKQHFFLEVAYHVFEPSKYMKILNEKRALQKEGWERITQWINSHSDIFDWVPPEAAYIAFPKLKLDIDTWTFCTTLLNEYNVLVVPGTCYGFDDHIRIGCGKTNMENLAKAIVQVDKYLETLT